MGTYVPSRYGAPPVPSQFHFLLLLLLYFVIRWLSSFFSRFRLVVVVSPEEQKEISNKGVLTNLWNRSGGGRSCHGETEIRSRSDLVTREKFPSRVPATRRSIDRPTGVWPSSWSRSPCASPGVRVVPLFKSLYWLEFLLISKNQFKCWRGVFKSNKSYVTDRL